MEREKSVDESWKESAAQEKEQLEGKTQDRVSSQASPESGGQREESSSAAADEADFSNYIASLGYQAMIFLGEVPHPVTQAVEKDLTQAKWIIDILMMLQRKTNGNLTKREVDLLNTTAYELQMRYVEASEKAQKEKTA